MPWYAVDHITIEERSHLHEATKTLLTLLMDRIEKDHESTTLTSMLLKRVWRAALKCPGFTPTMKDNIVYICGLDEQTAVEYGLPPYADNWKDLWTIGPKPGVQRDVLQVRS